MILINDIFSWTLEKTIRFFKNKDIFILKKHIKAKNQYLKKLNTVKWFIKENIIEEKDEKIKLKNTFEKYLK